MKKVNVDKELKKVLKGANMSMYVRALPGKKKFAVIQNIKRIFDDELLIRKIMKNEMYKIGVCAVNADIVTIGCVDATQLLSKHVDQKTGDAFLHDFYDFICDFIENGVDTPVIKLAMSHGDDRWSMDPTIELSVARAGRDVVSIMKTFNKMQNFQDTFDIITCVKLGMFQKPTKWQQECEDFEPDYDYEYIAEGFGPFAISGLKVDDSTITLTLELDAVRKQAVFDAIPEEVEIDDYFISLIDKFNKDNKPAKAALKAPEKAKPAKASK